MRAADLSAASFCLSSLHGGRRARRGDRATRGRGGRARASWRGRNDLQEAAAVGAGEARPKAVAGGRRDMFREEVGEGGTRVVAETSQVTQDAAGGLGQSESAPHAEDRIDGEEVDSW